MKYQQREEIMLRIISTTYLKKTITQKTSPEPKGSQEMLQITVKFSKFFFQTINKQKLRSKSNNSSYHLTALEMLLLSKRRIQVLSSSLCI